MTNNKGNKNSDVGAPSNGMKKVLMLSTDQNIFKEGSEVRGRIIEYGNLFKELHIIVYTDANLPAGGANQLRITRISDHVMVYPTSTQFKPFYFFQAYKIGKKIIGNWKLEIGNCVISSQDPFETGLVGYWLKKKFKLPLQIQVHTDFLSPYFWRESFKNKIRVLVGKWLIKKANRIRAVSQRIKQSLVAEAKVLENKIDVLPIFVDVEKIKNASIKTDLHKKYPEYDFIILMASRLTREKNIELVLEAFARVKSQMLNVKCLLLIVGDGPEYKNLKVKCQRLNVATNVAFESWTDDLASYYKTADLFLLTSNYEGYGRTIIEAMAAGSPIIMTDVGLAGEFLKNNVNGTIIAVNDKNGLIRAFDDMIKNRERLKEFSQNNEKAVSHLMTKEEYLKKYEELL